MAEARVIIRNTQYNGGLRYTDISDLDAYLKAVSIEQQRLVPKPLSMDLFVSLEMQRRLHNFAESFDQNVAFLKEISSFEFQYTQKGFYKLSLNFPSSNAKSAKTAFQCLASNSQDLDDLRGERMFSSGYQAYYAYLFKIECYDSKQVSDGVLNVAEMIYALDMLIK